MTSAYWRDKRILVTGGNGFLGKHLVRQLIESRRASPEQIIIPRSKDTDLRCWDNCKRIVKDVDIVIHLAATVGGIGFNQKNPGTLFYDNISMGVNMIEASRIEGVRKFVQLGTVCSYPKHTSVPFSEEDLWKGYPEETNAPYGIAKKTLLVMAQAYRKQYGSNIIYLIPVNLYGPGDNFDLESSHVIPALIRKFVEATIQESQEVELWGTGNASREFLYVEDAVEGIILATEQYDKGDPVNLGNGREIRIRDLATLIAGLTGFRGKIRWNATKPDGQPRRQLDTSKAQREFGFRAKIELEDGLRKTIEWFVEQSKSRAN